MQIEIVPKNYFQTIKQFKFLQDIGVGSFGKVKLAIHRGTHKHYAIKIIDLKSNLTNTQIQLVSRQIKVHSKLDHPHIIKLWDTLLEDDKIFMIMDYAQKGSIFNYHSLLLKQGKTPTIQQIYRFFYQTLQAVKYLHSNDLMHRDIKPENLLLDQNLNVKLCDFGWATNQINTPRTTFCGTYQYMAPQMALEKSYDFRIDIWALGVLLYQLVHGRAPFQAQNLKIMKEKINKGSYQINSNCSNELKDLIVDILQFIPDKRLTIKLIENHLWVKEHQDIQLDQRCDSLERSVNIAKAYNTKKQKQKRQLTNKMGKHQHQRSMGNFIFQSHKNKYEEFADDQLDSSKIRQIQLDSSNLYNPLNLNKHQLMKKHKRNVTQPIDRVDQKLQQNISNLNLNKKMQILLGSLQTQADTPLNGQNSKTNFIKSNKKCKTQGQDDYNLFSAQIALSKKDIHDLQQTSQAKKKKSHMRTETGPIISNAGPSNHARNYSTQLKQNDKIKKRMKTNEKIAQKPNQRVKKIEQRFLHELAGKYSTDKLITNKNIPI